MTLLLQSPSFDLRWRPRHRSFRFESPGRSLVGELGVEVERGGRRLTLTTSQVAPVDVEQLAVDDAHGKGEEMRVGYREVEGVVLSVRIRLYPSRPFLLMRVELINKGPTPLNVERLFFRSLPEGIKPMESPTGFYRNGWQSWSSSGFLPADSHQHRLPWLMRHLSGPMQHNARTPWEGRPGRFWSESMGVVVTPGEALVAGGASLADQFVQVAVDLRPGDCQLTVQSQGDGVPISVGGAYASEWFYLEWVPLPNSDPLAQYAHTVARQMGATFSRSVPVGWSSWYIYFDKVAEVDVRDNLAAAALHADELPIELIQLDQGFEPIWGDWTEHNERFPHSLAALARRIRGSGLTPGLWLAPLTVHPHSELAREHPEWLLRDEGGAPVSAGLFTNPSFTNRFFAQALDPTHPGVEEYLRELITAAVREWGYPYLKLDFLYAGALPGKHHYPRVTRAQAYRRALRIVREAAGEEVFLVGCGAPLGPSIGLVDAMRIGPDTAPHWQPRLAGLSWPFRKDPMMPALRNSLRNVATRAWMHDRWWVNDPDNLMVRSGRTSLTEDEVLAQATLVGLSGGLLVLSDDLGDLSPEARRVAASLLPPLLGGGMDVLDLFRQEMPAEVVTPVPRAWATWQLVGLFNWESKEAELPLPVRLPDFDPGVDYHVVDFWNRRYLPLQRGEALPTFAVSPHGAVLLGLRRVHAPPQLVTTTFHISQGGEVTDWEVGEGEVTLRLELGRIADGEVWLTLPGAPIAATLEGEPLPAGALRAVAPGVWAVAFRLFDQGWLRVRYGEGGEG